jgi:short-subunit dehydrogenase involved in D-alanine esterification of teichoic acids
MKIMIIGGSSKVSKLLSKSINKSGNKCILAGRNGPDIIFNAEKSTLVEINNLISIKCDVYIINLGILYPKNIIDQTEIEIDASIRVNLIATIRLCEVIFNSYKKVKVFIIGSESGKKGSFDTTYFLTKAALRSYVKERYLKSSHQQLVLFSPSLISDAGMTIRRNDKNRLEEYLFNHPKKRFLTSLEVSKIVQRFIDDEFEYISNVEIEINGGKFARMVN